ncbi:YbaK/EbsC family protein [Vreelandella boliviensis]|uniref:YbaK/EbsC family protein n=1 Tax=Vreelandella boliviensis TaxID=223527 RepID=UPI001B8D1EFE|nr:YbaK/EbsC family protein [Halomonas boliviensis]MBS3667471.1 YbaK/EbsC family protein [Halomonas boliviensis]
MGIETVRQFFAEHAPDVKIEELETSTATVQLAADAHGVAPGQIAKTLAFKVGEKPLLIVASGDARIDNRKIRDTFGGKATMLDAETVMELTSHPIFSDEFLHPYDEVPTTLAPPTSPNKVVLYYPPSA